MLAKTAKAIGLLRRPSAHQEQLQLFPLTGLLAQSNGYGLAKCNCTSGLLRFLACHKLFGPMGSLRAKAIFWLSATLILGLPIAPAIFRLAESCCYLPLTRSDFNFSAHQELLGSLLAKSYGRRIATREQLHFRLPKSNSEFWLAQSYFLDL